MKYHFRLHATIAVLAGVISTAVAGDQYEIDAVHSNVAFRIGHMMGKVNGRFRKFEGKIDVDREHPNKSSVTVKIQVASIDTGVAKRDTHLQSEEFFNVAKYPEISFQSRSVKQTGPQSGDILGDLTMHGVTRTITLHAKLVTPLKQGALSERTRWEITCDPIKRGDFGLMFSAGLEAISMIGQGVRPKIEIEAERSK